LRNCHKVRQKAYNTASFALPLLPFYGHPFAFHAAGFTQATIGVGDGGALPEIFQRTVESNKTVRLMALATRSSKVFERLGNDSR
jgi:hypothetical protein